jgi:hypothetical protein
MKAKIFDVILHKLPPGKSPAAYLEEQLNSFFKQHQAVRVMATHMNTLVLPETSAAGSTEGAGSTVILFATVFYE